MPEIIDSLSLVFQEGGSDKVYRPAIVKAGSDTYDVVAAYGRRGSTLQHTTKATAVTLDKARKAFDKLISEKTGKGYRVDGDAPAAVVAAVGERDGLRSGIPVQLLREVDGAELEALLDDLDYVGLEKYDGERRLLQIDADGTAFGINRQGLYVPLTTTLAAAARRLPCGTILDGELLGDTLVVFDGQQFAGEDLLGYGYVDRHSAIADEIEARMDGSSSIVIARYTYDKRALLAKLQDENAEGIVLRKAQARYSAGRPNSGGDARKKKFYETCTVVVAGINNGVRSVRMQMLDGLARVDVGSVTIPPNKNVPAVGEFGEVRYLYAYRGGSLYQPVWLDVRRDVTIDDTSIAQLKYRREAAAS